MSDYIKRESRTFIEIADDLNDLVTELNDKIVELIREKNVDVVPVRHGHWLKSTIPCEQYVCSECGGAAWYYDYNGDVAKSKYCPNCGARMDGDEDDD